MTSLRWDYGRWITTVCELLCADAQMLAAWRADGWITTDGAIDEDLALAFVNDMTRRGAMSADEHGQSCPIPSASERRWYAARRRERGALSESYAPDAPAALAEIVKGLATKKAVGADRFGER